jgi:hypothetical protein
LSERDDVEEVSDCLCCCGGKAEKHSLGRCAEEAVIKDARSALLPSLESHDLFLIYLKADLCPKSMKCKKWTARSVAV